MWNCKNEERYSKRNRDHVIGSEFSISGWEACKLHKSTADLTNNGKY